MEQARRSRNSGEEEIEVDGVVLDRRTYYLDICVKASDALNIESGPHRSYRLDCLVNRVSYDRMMLALQVFTQDSSHHVAASKLVKDLLLYSYPNSIVRLHMSPGGLRLALPQIGELAIPVGPSPTASTKNLTTAAVNSSSKSSAASPTLASQAGDEVSVLTVAEVLRQPTAPNIDFKDKQSMLNIKKSLVQLEKQSPSSYRMTAAAADYSASDGDKKRYHPIFATNARLKEMAQPKISKTIVPFSGLYSLNEIQRAISSVTAALRASNSSALNPSQTEAVIQAILRPLSLIQGPPGTGKVSSSFCAFDFLLTLHCFLC